jgi:hypothetical protein
MGIFHDPLANLGIFLERLVTAIDHDAREPLVDAFLAKLEGIPMVKMDRDGDIGSADSGLNELLKIDGTGVLAGALGDLEHDGGLLFLASLHDRLEQLHVVDVKGAKGVFALKSLCK